MASGFLGDGDKHAGKYNMALARRAFNAGWPISDEMRAALINQLGLIALGGETERNQVAAARAIFAADRINATREGTERGVRHDVTISVGTPDERRAAILDAVRDELQRREISDDRSGDGPGPEAQVPDAG